MFRLGDLSITKLSVSIKYLVPIKEAFLEKAAEGIILPIVILLGEHESKSEEEKGFLSTLNGIAEKVRVDMYTEYTKGFTKYRYEYPNVRWRYADPRFWKNTVEEEVSKAEGYLRSLIEKDDLSEPNLSPFAAKHFNLFMRYLLECCRNDKTMRQFCKGLSTLMRKMLEEKVDGLKNLVHKQLKKYKFNTSIDFYCYCNLESRGMVSDKKVREEISHDGLDQLYNHIFQGDGIVGSYKNLIEKIYVLWTKFTACVLDMYFLVRMFKTPNKNINSYITVAHFDQENTNMITTYLYHMHCLYDLVYASDQPDRCFRLSEDADVNRDLDEYVKWRNSPDTNLNDEKISLM